MKPLSLFAIASIAAISASAGCSLITVEQKPFAPIVVKAERPDAPPPRVC